MKHIFLILIGFFILCMLHSTFSQSLPSYFSRNFFLPAPPGAYQNGLLGFVNPAIPRMIDHFEARFFWSTEGTDNSSLRDWGIFSAVRGLGFGVLRQDIGGVKVTDYKISIAGGSEAIAYGFGYGWSRGEHDALERERLVSFGVLLRPGRYFSLGLISNLSIESNAKEGIIDAALRPIGTPRLTLFGDLAIHKDQALSTAPWSAGAGLELLPGLNFVGRYFDDGAFTLGLNISFGYSRVSGQSHFNSNQKSIFNTYGVRIGEFTPNLFTTYFARKKFYTELKLRGRVDYLKYKLFDKGTIRYMDLIQTIEATGQDPRVEIIALNLSGLRILPEHAWEVREALKSVKEAGKKIVAFIDQAGTTQYHLASVADVIMMDPEGGLLLPGYLIGRTYFKGTLEKLGLGFEEWRFFKYKSAAESLSRESMSQADREQWQAFIDDQYELLRRDVIEFRKISSTKFDELINDKTLFLPAEAFKEGLVDTLCRWSSLNDVLKALTGKKKPRLSIRRIKDRVGARQEWGAPPSIAVVYGLGICAMDEGIKARWLEDVFSKLTRNDRVKAVVFRVDSPGGDGMASDVVAEAIKKCAQRKPVIVSQGQVAGSGGYWISMYGDSILAGPNTVTGSIGVIGGWLYDKGFAGKLGLSADHVQRGKHADLGFGIRLPFLGVRIPARNLTPEEYARMEHAIKSLYQRFVKKVAQGRDMPVADVEKIAQGHIYSGVDGKSIGLVDEIGGLAASIQMARVAAHISPDRKVEILEIPKYRGLIRFGKFNYSPFQTMIIDASTLQFIKMFSKRPGFPLPILLPGTYPTLD